MIVNQFLVLAALLFSLGIYGVLVRRNAVLVLLSVELMLTAVNMVNWADRNVVPILFPGIRHELGLSDTQLGIIGGLSFSAIYAISSFGFGYAADRTIRRGGLPA